jgi:hypothetical protein
VSSTKQLARLIERLRTNEFPTYRWVLARCDKLRKVPRTERVIHRQLDAIERSVYVALRAEVREVCRRWKRDEYDNFKDALYDCRDLIADLLPEMSAERKRLVKVLAELVVELRALKRDPELWPYVRDLVPVATRAMRTADGKL